MKNIQQFQRQQSLIFQEEKKRSAKSIGDLKSGEPNRDVGLLVF